MFWEITLCFPNFSFSGHATVLHVINTRRVKTLGIQTRFRNIILFNNSSLILILIVVNMFILEWKPSYCLFWIQLLYDGSIQSKRNLASSSAHVDTIYSLKHSARATPGLQWMHPALAQNANIVVQQLSVSTSVRLDHPYITWHVWDLEFSSKWLVWSVCVWGGGGDAPSPPLVDILPQLRVLQKVSKSAEICLEKGANLKLAKYDS